MFCADSLEGMLVHPARNAAHRVPAQNIHVMYFGEPVAEFFHLNCSLRVTLLPQEMHTFSDKCDSGLLSLRCLGRCHNEITQKFQKTNWIRCVIEHQCRERVSSIQRDISALFNSRTDVQAVCLQ